MTDIDDNRVLFSHFPVFDNNSYDKKYQKITNILNRIFILTHCKINIHGHTHSKSSNFQDSINVSVENIDFYPMGLSGFLL